MTPSATYPSPTYDILWEGIITLCIGEVPLLGDSLPGWTAFSDTVDHLIVVLDLP